MKNIDDKQEFDETCKRIKELDDQLETLNDERARLWALFERLHKDGVQGTDYGSIMKVGRRKVGKNPNLPALENISHALVKHVEGKFEFSSHMANKLLEIQKLTTNSGLTGTITDPTVKPRTITEVETFLKDNPKYNRQRKEIMEYMDIQHGTGTLVIFCN